MLVYCFRGFGLETVTASFVKPFFFSSRFINSTKSKTTTKTGYSEKPKKISAHFSLNLFQITDLLLQTFDHLEKFIAPLATFFMIMAKKNFVSFPGKE